MARLAPVPRLRGREVELRTVGDAFDRVAAGHPATVLVEGEAGIGKTRLLAEVSDDARGRGLEVVTGRAQELERTRPFGVLADTLACTGSSPDPRRRAIAGLLTTRVGDRGPLTVSSDPGLQFQAVDAFGDLIEALALRGPLVLALDDLQWADPSSLLTLASLPGRLADVPLGLIGCLRLLPRPAELERALDAMAAGGAQRLALGPLGDDTVAGLVAEVVDAEPGRRLLAEVAGAGGNPLFVTELVAALLREGAIQVADGRAEVAEVTLPPTLRLTILRRLTILPDDTLQALRAASILGSAFSPAELSTTTERSALALAPVLEEAIRAGFLVDDGDRLRFRHDLLREALYEDLPASLRLALHREAGQRLARSGAAVPRVAEHLARGATPGDVDAVAWLTRAANEAARRSPAVAAQLLGRAIELADPADPGRDRLLVDRAGALMWSGRLPEAEAALRSLLDREPDPSVEPQARVLLARTLATQGRLRDTLRELERVQRSAALGEELFAGARAAEAMARLQLGDLDGAVIAAEQARCTGGLPDDHPAVVLAMTALAIVEELRANLGRGLQLIDEAVRLADQSAQRRGHQEVAHLARGNILMGLDRLQDARASLQTGRRISEELGVRWRLPLYQAVLGMERYLAGEWDDAMAELQAALDLTEETGERHSTVVTHSVISLIALHRGELHQAREATAVAERELADSDPHFRTHWATWARALLLEAEGAAGEAYASLAGCWELCERSGFAIEYPVLGADLVRLALAAGERAVAEQAAAAVAEVAAGNDVASLTGAFLRCQGLVTDDPEVLRAAVDAYRRASRPLELALAAEDAAAALARRGRTEAAVPLLRQALELHERLDAARGVARVEASLRSQGVRRGRRGPRKRPQLGWESLTPTERQVVDLVVEGLSNPQIGERLFVSPRTVQTHVAHVFTKLQVSSRAQLAAQATRRRSRG
jgi:DNA-binding CsgD family transcriptional regulator